MLDQNTTTVLTTLITVLGTLGGAFGGAFFSNRHSSNIEKLRIEQDKLKKNTEIIEETYSQLMLFAELSNQIASEVLSGDVTNFIEKSKEVYLVFNRLYVLIKLYRRPLKEELGNLNNAFNDYWIKVSILCESKMQKKKTSIIEELIAEVEDRRSKYNIIHLKLQESLEALVS